MSQPAPADHAAAPSSGKKRMSLLAQVAFINDLLGRSANTEGFSPGYMVMDLTPEEYESLLCIRDTLDIFELYRADDLVRERINRRRR